MPESLSNVDSSSQEYKKARRLHLKATRHKNEDHNWTSFRTVEKKFKARFPPPDLSNVLDLATLNPAKTNEVQGGVWTGRSDTVEYREIVLAGHATKGYTVSQIPGLVILPSFLSSEQQQDLVKWSLSEQARSPNETNLDTHYVLPSEGIWANWLCCRNDPSKDILIYPKALVTTSNPVLPGPRQLVENTPANPHNFSALASIPKPPQVPSPNVQAVFSSTLIPKLRWANIGWYYHWGTKQYDFAQGKAPIHDRVKNLCKGVVESIDWGQIFSDVQPDWGDGEPDWRTWRDTYEPDAGIVNFYQGRDTLMAHVDRSEVCATSPLVSISLGNAAIFLIGGLTRDTEPIPIMLRSGDVVIMAGPWCRRAYHGIPRILEGTLPSHLQSEEPKWQPYKDYMQSTRININVRQVFPKGFNPVMG
ncbi:hypothetical protein BDZ94DRAFT_1176154 [Collybia nuda]|uniref:Fe2OG dioxygenase domain-containing protein n=1 Tax=Collybia nuda TaxID=64659 RepID=A0A9P6CDM9_9AGAR|nr:hypothetical protein BDZ94DRAFT_1176154 [Collybia nuda]